MKHFLNWQVGFCDTVNEIPKEFFEAEVPGAVQLDLAKAKNLPDYRREKNYEQFTWCEDKFWVYKTEFNAENVSDNIFLIGKGIDYQYDIYANGELLFSHTGLYSPIEVNLSEFKGQNIELEIVVYPVPKSDYPMLNPTINVFRIPREGSRDQANQSCKPAVSYSWDFHPRLVPLGIWDDIYIFTTKRNEVIKPQVSYKLSGDYKNAKVTLSAKNATDAKWTFYNPDGKEIFNGNGEEVTFKIEDVKLWWCNGYGEPTLYSWKLEAENGEDLTGKVGFRSVALVKGEGSWMENLKYPMTCNTPPITLQLNGIPVFMKGTNWVAPEIFYGTLSKERYLEQLELVKKANLNFVRCWGGAVVNKDSFFEICDELGIMVWQEFPLACNRYVGTKYYISQLKTEATAIIDRLKGHPCMMLFCGGNELFNNWSCMTEQDEAFRLLNHLLYTKAPKIPFIATAPIMGMAHGPYAFIVPDGRETIEAFINSHFTAYTEFGVPGIADTKTLEMITDLDKLFPLNKGNEITEAHGGHWRSIDTERYFGKAETFEEFQEQSQLIQGLGYKFIFEETRRQKPYCSMAANWCFNEPWPNVGNNSLVSYPNNVKPALYDVADACRKVLLSARFKKFQHTGDDFIDFDLYLLNDSLEKVEDGTVDVFVKVGNEPEVKVLSWDYKNVEINTNLQGPTVNYKLPDIEGVKTLKIILKAGEYSSEYTLAYKARTKYVTYEDRMNEEG